MQAWKPLLFVVPAGLLLGAIGGNYARPVMTQRLDDSSLQALFETRAQRYGTQPTQAAPEDATYSSDQYSYPPYLDDRMLGGDREITGWQGATFANWPEYKPSAAELEAQVAARDAALGQRAWAAAPTAAGDRTAAEAAAAAADDVAANAGDAAVSAGTDSQGTTTGPKVVVVSEALATPSEPRTADGKLPAIW